MVISESIGLRIKQLRQAKGLNGRELAAASNISASFLSDIERGRTQPSLATIESLAKGLGITVAQIFEDSLQHTEGELESFVQKYRENPRWRTKMSLMDLDTLLRRLAKADPDLILDLHSAVQRGLSENEAKTMACVMRGLFEGLKEHQDQDPYTSENICSFDGQ